MSNVSISLRLRPIRFAFLVRPDDAKHTLEIFRVNSCLWGGQFNPIIPYLKRLPKWWEREDYRFENAKQVVNGYLEFFEPDFLVEAEKGLADGLGFNPERVLKFKDLLAQDRESDYSKYGISVFDLYKYLYTKEFQFERRHKRNFVNVKAKDAKLYNFSACIFGDFPNQRGLKYFERAYKDVFDPLGVSLGGDALAKLYKQGFASPLSIGHDELKIDYHDQKDPMLFILDAHKSRDLIDFWNLRAVHRNVTAIPVQWMEQLSPYCKQFIRANYRPLPGNPHGVMIQPTSMFSRSIAEDEIEEIYEKFLRVEKKGANVLQTWYPPIWREPPEIMFRTMRPTLACEERRIELPTSVDQPEIRFDTLFPSFASEFGGRYRWANVVKLRNWGQNDQIATVFPCNYKNPNFPNFGIGRENN